MEVANLGAVAAKSVYAELLSTPPPPKVEAKWPAFCWPRIWGRLALAGLPSMLVDVGFSYLHNILPLQTRRHRMRMVASPACLKCGAGVEDVLHFFTACTRVWEAWEVLALAACRALGGPLPDFHLLMLNLPIHENELAVVLAVLAFTDMVWASRLEAATIAPGALKARVRALARSRGHFRSLFDV